MKTKMIGLIVALFTTLAFNTAKAQTIIVDNQLSCSILVVVDFYFGGSVCGSVAPSTAINGGSSVSIPLPGTCSSATAFAIRITNAGGTQTPNVTATSNGIPVTFPPAGGALCTTAAAATVVYTAPLTFKVF